MQFKMLQFLRLGWYSDHKQEELSHPGYTIEECREILNVFFILPSLLKRLEVSLMVVDKWTRNKIVMTPVDLFRAEQEMFSFWEVGHMPPVQVFRPPHHIQRVYDWEEEITHIDAMEHGLPRNSSDSPE